jgi:hypothetical protein
MLMTAISLSISLLRRSIDKDAVFLKATSVTRPILFLTAVVLVTAKLTGGIGFSALGSSAFGGKKYFYILMAVAGFFALTAKAIPKERAKIYTGLFFLSGLTAVVSNLAYMGGPGFYFLFGLFPVEFAAEQAMGEQSMSGIVRISGLTFGCLAVYCLLLANNGIQGVFDIRKPWKTALFLLAAFASLLTGFRSGVIVFSLIFLLLFYFEGLHRTRWLPASILGAILLCAALLPFVSKMPYSVQRALSILPIEVSPVARADAANSSEWRLEMWRIVIPQVPQYLLKGKGYALNPTDLYMAEQRAQRGLAASSDVAITAGDYHNGPLSVIIPFGIFGVIGFVWFVVASLRALYRNYRFGDPSLRKVNAFLLAYFLAKTIFFLLIFGSLSSELYVFVGLIGFSISLNGGIREKPALNPVRIEKEEAAPILGPA